MVDRLKLEQMLANLARFRLALQTLAATPRATFLADADKIGSAKYHFIVAIECCIDIANHLIASEGFRMPATNADSLAILVEQGILPADTVDRFRAMARFRNQLVHLYGEVDDEALYAYLREGLGDLDLFAAHVGRWVHEQG